MYKLKDDEMRREEGDDRQRIGMKREAGSESQRGECAGEDV
jgi:hypothetical protein